jgi:hypothetical protein
VSRSGKHNGHARKPADVAHRARVEMFKRIAGEGDLDARCHELCEAFKRYGVLEPSTEDVKRARDGVQASVHQLRPPDTTPGAALLEVRERLPA